MTRTPRPAAVALVLLAAGCSSNNTGKIVGRWRAEPADDPVQVVWEFAADGSFSVLRLQSGRPEPNGVQVAAGRYALGVRDIVAFTNLNPPLDGKTRLSERVVIDGDTMTVGGRGDERAQRFTRLPN